MQSRFQNPIAINKLDLHWYHTGFYGFSVGNESFSFLKKASPPLDLFGFGLFYANLKLNRIKPPPIQVKMTEDMGHLIFI